MPGTIFPAIITIKIEYTQFKAIKHIFLVVVVNGVSQMESFGNYLDNLYIIVRTFNDLNKSTKTITLPQRLLAV